MKKFDSIKDWLDYTIEHTSYDKFYPSAIKRQVWNATNEELYGILTEYTNQNKLSLLYEIRCPYCAEVLGTYEYYADMPSESECGACDHENIERFDNVFVLYKIIRPNEI